MSSTSLALLFTLLFAHAAQADFLDYHTKSNPWDFTDTRFIMPNERNPLEAEKIFGQLPEGVYISVGTERGFISTALSPATYYLGIDVNPTVVNYNRVNILLLKAMAEESGPIGERMTKFENLKTRPYLLEENIPKLHLSDAEKKTLIAITKNPGWHDITDKMRHDDFFNAHAPNFEGARYWANEGQFKKLMTMAKENRMQAELVNLNDPADMTTLAKALAKANVKVSALDVSNAHWTAYAPDLGKSLKAFAPSMPKDSLVVSTWNATGGTGTYKAATPAAVLKYSAPGAGSGVMDHILSNASHAGDMKDGIAGGNRLAEMPQVAPATKIGVTPSPGSKIPELEEPIAATETPGILSRFSSVLGRFAGRLGAISTVSSLIDKSIQDEVKRAAITGECPASFASSQDEMFQAMGFLDQSGVDKIVASCKAQGKPHGFSSWGKRLLGKPQEGVAQGRCGKDGTVTLTHRNGVSTRITFLSDNEVDVIEAAPSEYGFADDKRPPPTTDTPRLLCRPGVSSLTEDPMRWGLVTSTIKKANGTVESDKESFFSLAARVSCVGHHADCETNQLLLMLDHSDDGTSAETPFGLHDSPMMRSEALDLTLTKQLLIANKEGQSSFKALCELLTGQPAPEGVKFKGGETSLRTTPSPPIKTPTTF